MAVTFLPPYAIDDTVIPAAALRRQVNASAGAGSGVVSASDLVVSPLNTPGPGFRVGAGDVLIESRDPQHRRETYHVSLPSQGTVEGLAGTGSSAGRRDMVIVEVLDSSLGAHFTPPAQWAEGESVRVSVVQGVPAGATTVADVPALNNVTCYALATIQYPASTATITGAMITRRAQMHTPKMWEAVYARPRISADDGAQSELSATGEAGEYFPGGVGVANQFQVKVPDTATRAVFSAKWIGIIYNANTDPQGRYWIQFGTEQTQEFIFDAPVNTGVSTDNWFVEDEVPIPEAMRGKTITVYFKARYTRKPSGGNSVRMNGLGGLACRITFAEKTDAPDLITVS